MTPVDMLQFADKDRGVRGDCFRCCIASLLDMKAEDVPHFVEIAETTRTAWQYVTNQWLTQRGLLYVDLPVRCEHGDAYIDPYEAHSLLVNWWPTYVVLTGPAERGFRHCVIGKGLEVVHDPHPSRSGLLKIECVGLLVRYAAPVQ